MYYNWLRAPVYRKRLLYFLILKDISERIPEIGFKGGTALAKVYKATERFSEDIDISYTVYAGDARRRTLRHSGIIPAYDKFGLTITNPEDTRSRRNAVQYDIEYISVFPASDGISATEHIKLETSHIQPIAKSHMRYVHSYIGDCMTQINPQAVMYYNLQPFPMLVQDIDLTFADKVFAVCDYYLRKTPKRNSRHIYDLFKLFPYVQKILNMRKFVSAVRAERQTVPKKYLSCSGCKHSCSSCRNI